MTAEIVDREAVLRFWDDSSWQHRRADPAPSVCHHQTRAIYSSQTDFLFGFSRPATWYFRHDTNSNSPSTSVVNVT